MFVDWKNQYRENKHTTQTNLQIQCDPCQATNGIFHRPRTNSFTIFLETQKTSNNQNNLEKEEGKFLTYIKQHRIPAPKR